MDFSARFDDLEKRVAEAKAGPHAPTLVACGHGDSAVGRGGEVVRAGDSLPVRPEMHA
jgi:hypothetical protein